VLIDIAWGPLPGATGANAGTAGAAATAPLLALIGKGVVFDTGGLNLKTAAGMKVHGGEIGVVQMSLGALRWGWTKWPAHASVLTLPRLPGVPFKSVH
jgi:hypothetical protein